MSSRLRLVLALHDHQPVGNFSHVFEQAYADSYQPFLDVFERYSSLRMCLHTSGPLLEWLDANRPDYVDRLRGLAAAGRIEILGGPFYEPILSMLTRRDRIGQLQMFSRWLESRLGAVVRGAWIPERVWEPTLTSDLAAAGIEYTLLDDFHFKNAGLVDEQLTGYYLTEDEGRLLKVFPGSERLRYLIPFADPRATIDYLRAIHQREPEAVIVFGDDGEKFGTWPETRRHVYDDGWLTRFFDALTAESAWLETVTLSDAVDHAPPVGKIYLPDSSYREMTEWVLPTRRRMEYHALTHGDSHDPRIEALKTFVRGGFWRNFKVKYAAANDMYCRMLHVSQRLQDAEGLEVDPAALEAARRELYRGQCNCAYWHGAFGGIYLPHLRNAVYRHLIAADNLLDRALARLEPYVEASADDFNLDVRQEVRLANDRLIAWFAPARGGQMYELDLRAICLNVLATLARQPEAYHANVQAGASAGDATVASIHDRVVFKQPGLDQRLQYDAYPRASLLDHFYAAEASADDIAAGAAPEQGDFVQGVYEARIRRRDARVLLVMERSGHAFGQPLKIVKSIALEAGSNRLEVAYVLSGMPPGRRLPFAIELNFAGLPAGCSDRYFLDAARNPLGELGSRLELSEQFGLALVDEWQGLQAGLTFSRATNLRTFPIETVSQSEGGFEAVHQSVVVLPHWTVEADEQGQWQVSFEMRFDTSRAEGRVERPVAAVTST